MTLVGTFGLLLVVFSVPAFSAPSVTTHVNNITQPAYNITRNDNLAVYWGQDGSGKQQDISAYCQDSTIDNVIISFLDVFFGKGGQPEIDLANICSGSGSPVFSGTDLADCSFMAPQIQACQKNGKIVTLSLGGADSKPGFSSDSQAQVFADQIWNSFLGGSGAPRPFGNAVLDGVDLDIEKGSPSGYAAFVKQIRMRAKGAKKQFFVTAAPQCPFPDANIGEALNGAPFDAVYVQFYNNFCGLDQPQEYNFATWDKWAKTVSANKNIKVYIGAPASKDAAGTGYVDVGTLANFAKNAQKTFSSFGGVMLWEASLAVENNNFHKSIKTALSAGEPPRLISQSGTLPTPTTTLTTTFSFRGPPIFTPKPGSMPILNLTDFPLP